MVKELTVEERFHELMKEVGLKILDAGLGMNTDLLKDVYVAARMLKEGYPLKEIVKTLKRLFMNRTGTNNTNAANKYADMVLEKVNDQLKDEAKGDPGKVYDELERHLSTDRLQFREREDRPALSIGQKGSILARMVVVDGFSLSAVEEAARENKSLGLDDAEELKKVMASCRAIADRYKAIEETTLKTRVKDPADIYRQYAKEYMQETRTPFLSPQDDEKILANLCMEIRYSMSKRLPNTEESRKKLDDYMRIEILPACSKAIEAASPVAAEGWRNKSQYVPCVMHGSEHFRENLIEDSEKYEKTQKLVDSYLDSFDKAQEESRYIYPAPYLDTSIAKELIVERQSNPLIERAIEENTRISGRGNFIDNNFESNKRKYAKAVVEKARNSYNREQELLYRKKPSIPQKPYSELREDNISAADLYLEAVKERLEMYPTFRLHMSDAAIDEEMAASIISKHPDVDLEELKEAIADNSPRAAILGIPGDYAEKVVERAKTELEQATRREKQVLSQQQLFHKSRGFAQEAFSDNPMEDYQNCKVAIDMLQDNIPEVDVKQMIKDIAPQEETKVQNPELYASQIVSSAKRVIERSQNIIDFEKDPTVASMDLKDLYMSKAQKILRKKDFPDSNMDVEVYKEMKLEGISDADIHLALSNYSPSAMEAGRDAASYCEFVKSSAEFMLREEQEKLENYIVIPRLEEAHTPDDEYEFQRKKMTDYISLPFSPTFDTKLARGLLEKNLEEEKVAAILDKLSPLSGRAADVPEESYGRSRVKEALQGMRRMVLVDEKVHEETKVIKHDEGMAVVKERTLTKTYATDSEEE